MRIAVLHPQTAFVRGGAETHAEAPGARAARRPATTPTSCRSPASGTRRHSSPTRWPCGAAFDITESNGLKVDAVIALKFPAYLVEHERKIVWLIHQHRTAYELWDHPVYADLSRQDDGSAVRDMVWNADRLALNEAKRVFTNSQATCRTGCGARCGIRAEVAVSPVADRRSICWTWRPPGASATTSCSPAAWRASSVSRS